MKLLKRLSTSIIPLAAIFAVCGTFADQWDSQDDSAVNGTSLVLSKSMQVHGIHDLSVTDSNDWFKCELQGGIPYQFESTGSSDVRVFLYEAPDASFPVLEDDQGGEGDNFLLLYMPPTNGTYYLNVQSFPVGVSAFYSLEYSIYAADSWDPDDNLSFGGTELTVQNSWQTNGLHRLNFYDELDWYRVHLTAGEIYQFQSLGNSDVYIELYEDPESSYQAEDDDSGEGLNFRLEYTARWTGIHYLKVGDWDSESRYDLIYFSPNGVSDGDEDGDGLPDIWEVRYFGHITNGLPNMHSDSDLFVNLQEYIAGTDPTNSASYFAVTNFNTGSFLLEWPVVSNREYRVYWTDSFTNDFSQQGPVIDYPVNGYTDTAHSAEDAGFYKVEVRLK